ncbi:transferrin-binding protein-like solute binding protein [Rhodoferax sp. 4810]|nr:transferrin-binding protein-like solute binding protein [Rhodoferax jenense]
MKTRKTLIAAAVTMMLACGQMALAAQQMHEDQWDKIKLYGNTTIASDSPDDWGPWKEFVQPAAGAPSVALLGALGSDPYRPLPLPIPTGSEVCRAGDMCGYAVFYNYDWNHSSDGGESYSSNQFGLFPAKFGLTLKETGQATDGGEYYGSETPIAGSWRVASLFGEAAPTFGESGDLTGTQYKEYYYGEYDYFDMDRYDSESEVMDRASVSGYTKVPEGWWYGYYATEDVAVGWFYRYINGTVNGSDGGENGTEIYGHFVAGYTTPLSDMAALQAGNVVATYSGSNSGWYYGNPSQVSMSVNFGNSTWSGAWNGGIDGSVGTWTDSAGRVNIGGQVGFTVTGGAVSGANFSATSANLSALDGAVSGNVQGSFYGPQARTVAGVVAITKTVTAPQSEMARIAIPTTYTNGKLTDVFVAVKDVPR